MGGGRTAKKRTKAARRMSAAASRVAKAEQLSLQLQPEPEPGDSGGFDALPLPRVMVTCDSAYSGTPELRVVTYNILAQTYFQGNPRQQATCPPGKRGQKARHALLMDELDNLIGDVGSQGSTGSAVICMQEVEACYLDTLLRPALASRGYTVLFLRKVGGKDPCDAYRQVEGVAIAWRGAAELVEHQEVNLDQAVLAAARLHGDKSRVVGGGSRNLGWSDPKKTHHEACAAALPYPPGSVALLARLRNPATGAELAVGTVHIFWQWKRHDIQTLQARITADRLLAMAAESERDCPAILCGDFNAQPNSALYSLLHRGSLSVCPLISVLIAFGPTVQHAIDDLDIQNKQLNMLRPPETPQLFDAVRAAKGYGPLVPRPTELSPAATPGTSSAGFASAYFTATGTEPRTNFTSYFSACLDYIWFAGGDLSDTGLSLRGVLKMPRSDAFKTKKLGGCPNEFCPSDHLPLMADFDWRSDLDRASRASDDAEHADKGIRTCSGSGHTAALDEGEQPDSAIDVCTAENCQPQKDDAVWFGGLFAKWF